MTRQMEKSKAESLDKDRERRKIAVTFFLEEVDKGHYGTLSQEYRDFFVELINDNSEKVIQLVKTNHQLDVNIRCTKKDIPYPITLLLCVYNDCPRALTVLLQNGLDPYQADLANYILDIGEHASPEVFKILIEWGVLKKLTCIDQAILVSNCLKDDSAEEFPKRLSLMALHGLDIPKMLSSILEIVIENTERRLIQYCAKFDYIFRNKGEQRAEAIRRGNFTPLLIINRISNIRYFLRQSLSWHQVNRKDLNSLLPLIASTGALFIIQVFLEQNLLDEDKIKDLLELAKQKLPLPCPIIGCLNFSREESEFITKNITKPFVKWLRRYLIIGRILSKGVSKSKSNSEYFVRFPIPQDIARKIALTDLLSAPLIDFSTVLIKRETERAYCNLS